MNLSEYSVRKPILAIIIIASVSLLGFFSVNQLPLLMLPEFDNPFLMVFVSYRSTSPQEIENNITETIKPNCEQKSTTEILSNVHREIGIFKI